MPRKKKISNRAVPESVIEDTINRINECQIVLDEIEKSQVWRILLSDLDKQKQQIDDNWQDLSGEKLEKARIIKFATNHILSLKDMYSEELKQRKGELKLYQNTEESIIKDYDNETIVVNTGDEDAQED